MQVDEYGKLKLVRVHEDQYVLQNEQGLVVLVVQHPPAGWTEQSIIERFKESHHPDGRIKPGKEPNPSNYKGGVL